MDKSFDNPEAELDKANHSESASVSLPKSPGTWERYGNFARITCRAVSVVGIMGAFALILFTVIDVLGSKIFSRPFPGYTGVTELSQLIAMSFGMGITYLGGHHIKVEIIKRRLPMPVQNVITSLIDLLSLALFVLIIWQLVVLGRAFQVSGEVVDQIFIPIYPFPYAMAVAMLPIGLVLLYELGNSVKGMVRR